MAVGVIFFIIVALIFILVWMMIELKRMKHKILALLLVGLIVFTYITFSISLRDKDIKLNTVPGLIDAGELYFTWLSSLFLKMKAVTMYAIGIDWKTYNESVVGDKPNNESIWNRLK